jgi:hypothetical protein
VIAELLGKLLDPGPDAIRESGLHGDLPLHALSRSLELRGKLLSRVLAAQTKAAKVKGCHLPLHALCGNKVTRL